MARSILKSLQQVFEVRYDQGYRYLDRCGDAMIILEEALPPITNNKIWMPDEAQPKGARMKCPDLDLTLVFDAMRLCLDQHPSDKSCPFSDTAGYALRTIASKFDIGKITRFGHRVIKILPADSIEAAQRSSLKYNLIKDKLVCASDDMELSGCDIAIRKETEDKSKGISLTCKSAHRADAPADIDARLRIPSHMLAKGQKEALKGQLQRRKQRETDPLAGLIIDIDFWRLNPVELSVEDFLEEARGQIESITTSFLEN